MKHIIFLLLALVMALTMAACSSEAETAEEAPAEAAQTEEQSAVPAYTEPDPEGALEEIYAQLDRETGLIDAGDEEVSDVMGFDLETIEEYYIRYVETDFGASDVYIIKPVEGEEETVRQAMKAWQESRIRSFSGYDIYNSTEISENALIFSRGDYLVMLMLEDNESARSIVEAHIPEELNLD